MKNNTKKIGAKKEDQQPRKEALTAERVNTKKLKKNWSSITAKRKGKSKPKGLIEMISKMLLLGHKAEENSDSEEFTIMIEVASPQTRTKKHPGP